MQNRSHSRGGLQAPDFYRLAAGCVFLGGLVPACGFGNLKLVPDPKDVCQIPVIAITSPGPESEVTVRDDRGTEPGVQIDVSAATSLPEGSPLSLSIVIPSGLIYAWPETVEVDGTGDAVFRNVTLPLGRIVLRVHDAGCSSVSSDVTVTSIGEATCILSIGEGPILSSFYHPIPVMNLSRDHDVNTAGLQTMVSVTTNAGFTVDIFILHVEESVEEALSLDTTSANVASAPLSLGDGLHALRAVCRSAYETVSAASGTQTILVDTVAPTCSFGVPADGSRLDRSADIDSTKDGTQFDVSAAVEGDDVYGESTTLVVGYGGEWFTTRGSLIDIAGRSTAVGMLWMMGTASVSLTTQDHAGNPCVVAAKLEYDNR